MSVYPNTGCHAVLALLSEGYPPLEGRSPTRYSPVCHSTCPLRGFRVRLACIRHAASVDSEPGSNSQVKFAARRLGLSDRAREQLVQPDRLLNWLSDSNRLASPDRAFSLPVPRQAHGTKSDRLTSSVRAVHPATTPGRSQADSERCPLILDGLCLHVLSSFQRTGLTGLPGRPPSDEFVRRRTYQIYDRALRRVNHFPATFRAHFSASDDGRPPSRYSRPCYVASGTLAESTQGGTSNLRLPRLARRRDLHLASELCKSTRPGLALSIQDRAAPRRSGLAD